MKAPSLVFISAVLMLAVMQVSSAPVLAGGSEFIVTMHDDPQPDGCAEDDCSLREAVIAANETAGADTVLIPGGEFILEIPPEMAEETDATKGDIDISDDVSITGAGTGEPPEPIFTAINPDTPNAGYRVFEITASADVVISNLRIRGGQTALAGGGIRNAGNLMINNVVLEDNRAAAGGALMNAVGGSTMLEDVLVQSNHATSGNGGGIVSAEPDGLTVVNSVFVDNVAEGVGLGGGIYTVGVQLQDSVLTGNKAGFDGGGIASVQSGNVIVTNSEISSNQVQSGDGGGIFMTVGNLAVSGSEISDNTAGDDGGGVYVDQAGSSTLISNTQIVNNSGGPMPEADGGGIKVAGTVVVENSTVSGNTTGNDGGGIVSLGPLTITNSTVSNNEAAGDGGGIDFDDGAVQNPQSLIQDTTIAGNTAAEGGGAIDNDGHLTITGSTISGNRAVAGGGGGIENDESLIITNSTISGNAASTVGGGLLVQEPGDTVSLHHVTIANNAIGVDGTGGATPSGTAGGSGVHIDEGGFVQYSNSIFAGNTGGGNCGGTLGNFDSNGYNLEDAAACPDGEGDINSTDPLLGPLADNGGPTMTHALSEDSPAVDAAVEDCPPPATDQRGVERPQGEACDIGAFELEEAPPGIPQIWGDSDCNGAIAATDALKTLQEVAALPYDQTEPCFPLGDPVGVTPAGFGQQLWGDVDCNGAIAATDALAILRHIAALPVNQEPGCPAPAEAVLVAANE